MGLTSHQIEILDGRFESRTVASLLGGRGRGVDFEEDPMTAGEPAVLRLTRAS